MHHRTSLLVVGLLGIFGVFKLGAGAQDSTPPPPDNTFTEVAFANALVMDKSGQHVGDVTFVEREDGKILITAIFVNLPPGYHGFHMHDHESCDMSPMPLWGEYHADFDATQHPNHAGDFPPLLVTEDGSALLSFATDRLTIQKTLYPGEGSSVMIHADPDNFANIPTRYSIDPEAESTASIADEETLMWGDTGEPIACGSIEPVKTNAPSEQTTTS